MAGFVSPGVVQADALARREVTRRDDYSHPGWHSGAASIAGRSRQAGQAMPWDERVLVAQVKEFLAEGECVALRDNGIRKLPLARLNTTLVRHGLMVHATKSRAPSRCVACTGKDGRVERYGGFDLRRIPPQEHEVSTEGGEGETAPRMVLSCADTR